MTVPSGQPDGRHPRLAGIPRQPGRGDGQARGGRRQRLSQGRRDSACAASRRPAAAGAGTAAPFRCSSPGHAKFGESRSPPFTALRKVSSQIRSARAPALFQRHERRPRSRHRHSACPLSRPDVPGDLDRQPGLQFRRPDPVGRRGLDDDLDHLPRPTWSRWCRPRPRCRSCCSRWPAGADRRQFRPAQGDADRAGVHARWSRSA